VIGTKAAMNVPVARPFIGAEEEQAVLDALRSGWVSQGPRVAEFEQKFAKYVGAEHAVAVSSCTTALHLALIAAGVKAGDEVLCPSLSFIATANCIVYAGATPVFVDIDPFTYNIDPASMERAITPRTKAVLVVHQVGLPAALDEINAIAKARGIAVVEDAACAIGSEYNGHLIGSPDSIAACFSFHPRKILTTGEGGMITTGDAELAARMRRLRQHAMSVSDLARHSANQVVTEKFDEVGYNYRMTDLQAAVGLVQLQRLDGMLARRRELAENYTRRLSKFDWAITPTQPAGTRHNYQSYTVRLKSNAPMNRDRMMQHLLDLGIATRRGVMPTHREKPYYRPELDKLLPQTNMVADTTIILPLFHLMTLEEQEYVITNIEQLGSGR
jgi:perosamine synthetase